MDLDPQRELGALQHALQGRTRRGRERCMQGDILSIGQNYLGNSLGRVELVIRIA
jgi:hypothetical protein